VTQPVIASWFSILKKTVFVFSIHTAGNQVASAHANAKEIAVAAGCQEAVVGTLRDFPAHPGTQARKRKTHI